MTLHDRPQAMGWAGLIATAALVACGGDANGPEAPADGFDRNQLLRDVVEQVIEPSVAGFAATVGPLVEATEADRDNPSPENLQAARDRWRATMLAWQRVEVLQIGPTARPGQIAGQGFRDELYLWPTINTCRVDRALLDRVYAEPSFPAGEVAFLYGIEVLEYLLFRDPNVQTCGDSGAVATGFQGLGEEERRSRRAAYAAAVAEHIRANANALAEQWVTGPEGFGRQLAAAGQEGSPYRSAQVALDELFAAIFYVELIVKDVKLARPLGIALGCPSQACPELLEAPHAGFARESIVENLHAFEAVFRGGASPDAVGFDDLLEFVGAPELSERMLSASVRAREALSAAAPLHETLATDRATVAALHGAVKELTDLLKTQFVTTLALRIPEEGAGDND